MRITEVYLEIASFIYLSLILYFYLRKKKINTIENKIFKAMIITAVLVCLSDAISTLYAIEYPKTILADILVKWKLITMSLELIFCSYYIMCITTKKSAGIVDFKEHPHKKYFIITGVRTIIICLIFTLAIIFGSLNITVTNGVFEYTGSALTACHIATVGSAISWLLMFISILRDITNKKYRQLLLLLAIGGVTIIVTIIFPVCIRVSLIALRRHLIDFLKA